MRKIGIILISILSFCFVGTFLEAKKAPTRRPAAKRVDLKKPRNTGIAKPKMKTSAKPLTSPQKLPSGWMVPKKKKAGPPPKAPSKVPKKPLPTTPTKAAPTPPAPSKWYSEKKPLPKLPPKLTSKQKRSILESRAIKQKFAETTEQVRKLSEPKGPSRFERFKTAVKEKATAAKEEIKKTFGLVKKDIKRSKEEGFGLKRKKEKLPEVGAPTFVKKETYKSPKKAKAPTMAESLRRQKEKIITPGTQKKLTALDESRQAKIAEFSKQNAQQIKLPKLKEIRTNIAEAVKATEPDKVIGSIASFNEKILAKKDLTPIQKNSLMVDMLSKTRQQAQLRAQELQNQFKKSSRDYQRINRDFIKTRDQAKGKVENLQNSLKEADPVQAPQIQDQIIKQQEIIQEATGKEQAAHKKLADLGNAKKSNAELMETTDGLKQKFSTVLEKQIKRKEMREQKAAETSKPAEPVATPEPVKPEFLEPLPQRPVVSGRKAPSRFRKKTQPETTEQIEAKPINLDVD